MGQLELSNYLYLLSTYCRIFVFDRTYLLKLTLSFIAMTCSDSRLMTWLKLSRSRSNVPQASKTTSLAEWKPFISSSSFNWGILTSSSAIAKHSCRRVPHRWVESQMHHQIFEQQCSVDWPELVTAWGKRAKAIWSMSPPNSNTMTWRR